MGMVVNHLNRVNCHYLIDEITFDPVLYIYTVYILTINTKVNTRKRAFI